MFSYVLSALLHFTFQKSVHYFSAKFKHAEFGV